MDNYTQEPTEAAEDFQHNEFIRFLTNSQEMRRTAKSSMKQSLYAGGGALAGGLLLGPVGGLVGGVAGSIIGFVQADDYDGAIVAICNLPRDSERRKELMDGVGTVLRRAGAQASQFESPVAFQAALAEYASRREVRDELWRLCRQSVEGSNNNSNNSN